MPVPSKTQQIERMREGADKAYMAGLALYEKIAYDRKRKVGDDLIEQAEELMQILDAITEI